MNGYQDRGLETHPWCVLFFCFFVLLILITFIVTEAIPTISTKTPSYDDTRRYRDTGCHVTTTNILRGGSERIIGQGTRDASASRVPGAFFLLTHDTYWPKQRIWRRLGHNR